MNTCTYRNSLLGWRWLPLVVAMALAALSFTLWQTALLQERTHRANIVGVVTESIKADISDDLEMRYLDLNRVAKHYPFTTHPGSQQVQTFSQYMDRRPECEGLAMVTPEYHVTWVVPPPSDDELRDGYFRHEAAQRAAELSRDIRNIVISRATPHLNHRLVSFWIPIFDGANYRGSVVGVFRLEPMLNAVLADSAQPGYNLAIFDGPQPIYTINGEGWQQQPGVRTVEVPLPGIKWQLEVWPERTPVSDGQPLSTVVLVGGLAFAIMSALILHLARRAHTAAYNVSEANQHLTQEVAARRRAEESLHVLSGRLLKVQDEERQSLANLLHEGMAQKLFALSLNLKVTSKWITAPEAHTRFQQVIDLADQCVCEMRALTHLLHPPSLDVLGLLAACETFVEGYRERTGIEVALEFGDEPVRFPRDMEMALFRVVQESLTNVQHHSGSKHARIRLAHDEGLIVLEIADDGCGVGEQPGADSGIGIAGMRERMLQLGGELHVESAAGGTTVRAILPYVPEREKSLIEAATRWESGGVVSDVFDTTIPKPRE